MTLGQSSLAPLDMKSFKSPEESPPLVKFALSFLSEYLSPLLFDLLLQTYNYKKEDIFPTKKNASSKWDPKPMISGDLDTSKKPVPEQNSKKRKIDSSSSSSSSCPSSSSSSATTPLTKKPSVGKKTAPPKTKPKGSTKGMKDIASFFGTKATATEKKNSCN